MKTILLLCLAACGGSGFAASTAGDASTMDAVTGDVAAQVDSGAGGGTDSSVTDSSVTDSGASGGDAAVGEAGPTGCVATGTGALGVLGCPCSSPGSLACVGNAQKVALLCSGGSWAYSQTCASGQLCDTATGPNQGSCVPIDPACTNATPGQNVCESITTVVACGPDLVSVSPVTTCPTTLTCIAGACATPPPCPPNDNPDGGDLCQVGGCMCPSGCSCLNLYNDGFLYCGYGSGPGEYQQCGQ